MTIQFCEIHNIVHHS